MEQKLVAQIFSALKKQNPTPKTELLYSTAFELLIAVMLSAQATDVNVNKATAKLFLYANTPQQFLVLGERGLKHYIKSIGLYNTKAKHIIQTCKMLVEHYNATVPDNRKDLEQLPGVGRKTANVILNEAFGKPTIAVDTHVLRVAKRIGLAQGKTPLQIEQQLEMLIPKKFRHYAHRWLILHGRYVCTAAKPKCKNCVIINLCGYNKKNL